MWVLLLSSSQHIKFCENLRIEDNFNNTVPYIFPKSIYIELWNFCKVTFFLTTLV